MPPLVCAHVCVLTYMRACVRVRVQESGCPGGDEQLATCARGSDRGEEGKKRREGEGVCVQKWGGGGGERCHDMAVLIDFFSFIANTTITRARARVRLYTRTHAHTHICTVV